MSRRGRRRNSRRKSSSSSKQSASTYNFQKQHKSNSVSYKDELTEKGETDSFRKEIVYSASDEEEEKYKDIPSKEKKFRLSDHQNSFHDQKNSSFSQSANEDKAVKIVTSVIFDDLRKSSPSITFQQSRETSSEDPTNSTVAVTNVTKVNCSGSCVKFEIQEILHANTSGIKTRFFIQNQGENGTEACFESVCERRLPSDDTTLDQSGQSLNAIDQNKNQNTINYKFSFVKTGEQTDLQENSKSSVPSRCCDSSICRKSCCDNNTDFTMAPGSSSPPSLAYVWPPGKRSSFQKSFSSDLGSDIPPPREFADSHFETLDDLTEDLASFMIGNTRSSGKQPGCFGLSSNRGYNHESLFPYSLDEEGCDDQEPCDGRFSDLDNFEPMFRRPSSSVSRSSFTKDFINNHERKTWVRNNSIGTVEHKMCSLPTKRRRTFPGISSSQNTIQESLPPYNRESFSSGSISPFIMHSLPLQADRLGRFYQGDDRLSPFGIESRKSSQSGCSYKPGSGQSDIQIEEPQLVNQFFSQRSEENPEEDFMTGEQFQSPNHQPTKDPKIQEMDFPENQFEEMGGGHSYDRRDQVEQSEVAESGFEEDMAEVGCHSPEFNAEELTQGDLVIQVTPPTRCGSEEYVLENNSTTTYHQRVLEDTRMILDQVNNIISDSEQPKQRKSSVLTITVGESEQRFLQTDSRSFELSSVEKDPRDDFTTALEASSMASVFDTEDMDSPVMIGVSEEVQPTLQKPLVGRTSISSPALSQIVEETKDPFDRESRGAGTEKSLTVTSNLSIVSTEQETKCPSKEHCHKTDKAEKSVSKASLEVKEHLRPSVFKDPHDPDHWAKRRKVFKDSKQWSSAGGSSINSSITEDSVSEEVRTTDATVRDIQDKGFYMETFHSAAWIYRGDEVISDSAPSLSPRPRTVSIRERTVKISKGMGEYPWGFRIQFSKPIVVTEVDTNGAAEEAGLMVGDYVLAVNGTDVTSVPHSEAADLARQGPDLLTLTIGSDIARDPNTPRPACRGYLHKRTQSGLIKGWRKRWFVLRHDCCLYYYRHKRDEGRQRALSAVKLEGAEIGPDSSLGKPFVFRCCPQSANRMYFFCATSNQDMKRWLQAMERAVHPITQNHVWLDVTRHNASLPPLAVKSPDCLGLLHQIDNSKDVWVQQYCILKDGCLYFYAGIRSTHALGGIYLHGYTAREQSFGSKKSTIELRAPSDEFKVFYLCAENPTENKRWIAAINASIHKWMPLHKAIQDYMSRPPEETKM